jgi:SAM-dependent methyltransferase
MPSERDDTDETASTDAVAAADGYDQLAAADGYDQLAAADGYDQLAAADGYDQLAAAADDELDPTVSPWGDSHFQEHYNWPAVERALPDAIDGHALIAGCGRGDHVPPLADRGASVVGVDVSESAIAAARESHPDAEFHVADLEAGLSFEDDEFAFVLCNLVLSHVPDWTPVLESFARVLADDGTLLVSTIHPQYRKSKWGLERYDERVGTVVDWGVAERPTYYRPTSAMLQAFLDAGFAFETIAEPTPKASYEAKNPERYANALESPQLLGIRATTN